MVLVSLFLVGKDVEGLEVAYVPGDGVRKLVVNEADMSMEGDGTVDEEVGPRREGSEKDKFGRKFSPSLFLIRHIGILGIKRNYFLT